MSKNFSKIILYSFFHAAGAIVYILMVSWFMLNAETLLGSLDITDANFFGPALFLSLFVLSAGVMAVLFFLKPILLFVEHKKHEALWFLGLTAAWFVFSAAIMFLVIALISSL